jgi:hypothetical protein
VRQGSPSHSQAGAPSRHRSAKFYGRVSKPSARSIVALRSKRGCRLDEPAAAPSMTMSFLVCLSEAAYACAAQSAVLQRSTGAKKLSLVSLLQNDLHVLIARTRNFDGDTDGSLFRLYRIEGLKRCGYNDTVTARKTRLTATSKHQGRIQRLHPCSSQ